MTASTEFPGRASYMPRTYHSQEAHGGTYTAYETEPYEEAMPGESSKLNRADTLVPGDSMSSYHFRNNKSPTPDHDYAEDYVYRDGYDHRASASDLPLKQYPSQMGYAEDEEDEARQSKQEFYSRAADRNVAQVHMDPEATFGLLGKLSPSSLRHLSAEDKLRYRIDRRRQGIGRQRYPIVTWVVALVLVIVFIVELVNAKQETGQAVQTRPSINPMLGPSAEFLISFGARFVPCMRSVPALPASQQLPCLQYSTSSTNSYTSDQLCPISQLCGLSNASKPNQSYRFISAMFVHAGFVHIFFNLLVQLTLCAQIEKLIGSIAYTLIYFAGGIGGNLLGGNFGLIGQPALGMSGAIYTCISVELVDLCYNWKYEYRARTRLIMSVAFAIVGLTLGLLPGLDNFSHIGGFCVGLLGGLLFGPAIHPTRRHRIIVSILRGLALCLLVAFFAGLAANFYNSTDPTKACTWCRYLSCLPVFNACKGDGLTTTTTTTTNTGLMKIVVIHTSNEE